MNLKKYLVEKTIPSISDIGDVTFKDVWDAITISQEGDVLEFKLHQDKFKKSLSKALKGVVINFKVVR